MALRIYGSVLTLSVTVIVLLCHIFQTHCVPLNKTDVKRQGYCDPYCCNSCDYNCMGEPTTEPPPVSCPPCDSCCGTDTTPPPTCPSCPTQYPCTTGWWTCPDCPSCPTTPPQTTPPLPTTPSPCTQNPVFSKTLYQSSLPSWPIAGTTVRLGIFANTTDGFPLQYELITSFEFLTLTAEHNIIFTSTIGDGAFVGANNVMLLEVTAKVIWDEERKGSATVAIVFPRSTRADDTSNSEDNVDLK